jgi:DNA-binding ferritin-like protein
MPVDPREKQAYMEASPAQREVVRKLLCNLLCLLRAQSLSYQTSHWQAVGSSAYGNHLLFMRLYESVQDQIDQLAEKIVGYLGTPAVNLVPAVNNIAQYATRWSSIDCLHSRGLQSEADCQSAIKSAYDGIKAAQAMTLGLDDWLMATANAHEENTYLLQQVKAQPPAKVAALVKAWSKRAEAPSAEGYFRPNPRKEEVAQFAETGAISNDPEVAAQAASEDHLDVSEPVAVAEAEAAPPTPTEIVQEPGGAAVSTLNRYVVQSEDPEADKAALDVTGRMAAWLREIEEREK